MGCDGGTIPKRDELVRQKKKPEQKDKNAELAFRWGHCTITQEPLQRPIVACQLGRLYSKVSVLEALLDKGSMPSMAAHIKGLKDIREVNLTDNPAFKKKPKSSETYDDSLIAPFICPVTGLEMNGKFRFVMFWSCGCVVSERAYKEVKAAACHKCQKALGENDMIVLNGEDEDVAAAKIKIKARKAESKSEKISVKDAKNVKNVVPSSSTSEKPSEAGSSRVESKTSSKRTATSIVLNDPLFKETKNDYSVSKDPNATDVYKSLFTTHENAAKQTKAHWVTYNPFYN